MNYNIFTGILKMFSSFMESSDGVTLTCDNSNDKFTVLRDKYYLQEIAGNGDELSKTLNILFWLSDSVFHFGGAGECATFNSLDLLSYSYKKGANFGINCRGLATILTECLLSLGIAARTLYIHPFSPYDEDNHVVTLAFIKTLNKWIMLDPSYNSYVTDTKNNILDVFEIRHRLAEQKPIRFNKEANHNGEKLSEDSPFYTEYLAKDLFYFETPECSKFGCDDDENNRIITICPKNFDVKTRNIYNVEYRIKKYGDSKNMNEWLKNTKENWVLYCSVDEFLKVM